MINSFRLLSHFILVAFTLAMIACDSSSSNSEVVARPVEKVEKESPTPPPFDTTITFQQFQTEFNAYAKNAASQVTAPHPCGDYLVRFATNNAKPPKIQRMLPTTSLCADISKYEAENARGFIKGSWHYTFMPVGERYYMIEGVLLDKSGSTVTYYYERRD